MFMLLLHIRIAIAIFVVMFVDNFKAIFIAIHIVIAIGIHSAILTLLRFLMLPKIHHTLFVNDLTKFVNFTSD